MVKQVGAWALSVVLSAQALAQTAAPLPAGAAASAAGAVSVAPASAVASSVARQPAAALPRYTATHLVQMFDNHWLAPRTVEFIRRAEALQQALEAHCQGGLVMPVRQTWRDALVAWDRLSTVSVGPLLERGSAQRVDAQPALPDALEKLLASGEAASPDLAQLDRQAQGFAALEWLLWMQPPPPPAPPHSARGRGRAGRGGKASAAAARAPKAAAPRAKAKAKGKSASHAAWQGSSVHGGGVVSAAFVPGVTPVPMLLQVANPPKRPVKKAAAVASKPAKGAAGKRQRGRRGVQGVPPPPGQAAAAASRTTSQPAACKLAVALAGGLRTEGLALAEGMAKRLDQRLDDERVAQRLDEMLSQWLAGLELLRVQAVEDPLQNKADRPRARAVLPRQLSGSSALDRQARWSALRSLAVQENPTAPAPGAGLVPLELWLRAHGQTAQADALREAAQGLDHALENALPNTPESLQAAAQAMVTLRDVMADQVVPVLKEASTPSPAGALRATSAPASVAPAPASTPKPAASAPAAAASR